MRCYFKAMKMFSIPFMVWLVIFFAACGGDGGDGGTSNNAPVIEEIGAKSVDEGALLEFTISATDPDGDTLAYSASDLPTGANFDPDTLTFSWTTGHEDAGNYEVQFTVTDNGSPSMSDSESVSITVNDTYNLKIDISGNTSTPANVTLSFSVETEAGEPVAGLGFEDFSVLEDGQEPHATESNFTPFPSPLSYDLYTVLMLDLSGSVTQSNLDTLIDASKSFVNVLIPAGQRIALYYFQTDIHQIQSFTDDQSLLNDKLDLLSDYVVSGATTNLYGGFIKGIDALDNAPVSADRLVAGSLAVFTDGKDMAGSYSYDQAKSTVDSTGHSVFTIGLSTADLDIDILNPLGKNGFEMAVTVSELTQAFNNIATSIQNECEKYYVLVYCSPKRDNAQHTVELIVTDSEGRLGYATYNFTASNFSDGCYDDVENLKLQYYDDDGDEYYSVDGPMGNDCDDSDPYNWISCDTCIDNDGDGYVGTGCDINIDIDDSDPNISFIGFQKLYIKAYTSDDDTLNATVTGHNMVTDVWDTLYSGSGGTRVLIDDSSPVDAYDQIRIQLNDTDDNDSIYYEYNFGSGYSGTSASTSGDIDDTIAY